MTTLEMKQPLRDLTTKQVLAAPSGRHRVSASLYLIVRPNGVRRWAFRYTKPSTKRVTEHGLGSIELMTLAEAKEAVHEMRRLVARGVDPIEHERDTRTKQTTFAEAADGWIKTRASRWGNSQMRNASLLLHHHGKPLSQKFVGEITPDHVQETLADLWQYAPNQARRTLRAFESVFDFAKAHGMRTGDNPAAWQGLHQYRFPTLPATDKQHFSAMHYDDLPGFIRLLRTHQNRSTTAVALEFTILCAARTSETLGMRWDEINFEEKLWTIPAHRMKAGRKHQVPLSARAIELLEKQRELTLGNAHVFTGYGQGHLSPKSMITFLRYMDIKESVHGFRSTFRNWCGDKTPFDRETVELCLAHQVGNEVERAYRTLDALEKRRTVMEGWASYCG
jgi:integrase